MNTESEITDRRSFLGKVAAGATGLMAAVATFMAGGFLYPVPRRKAKPLFVCLESQVRAGTPLEIVDPQGRKALLIRKDSGEMVAMGMVCSHLGCQVYYRPQKDVFDCPCHRGVFDGDGNPISGPPRQPLSRYPVEVREGKVLVQFG